MKQLFFFLLAFVWLLKAQPVNLDIYATGLDTIPVAIIPFTSFSGQRITDNKPWEVIASDLRFSERFTVHELDSVDTAYFYKNKIPLYISGEYSFSGDNIVVDCYLHDTRQSGVIFGKKYSGQTKHIRQMAHRYSSQLYKTLFGEEGIFQTRIVFVRREGMANKNLFIMDYDGHTQRRLTQSGTINTFPVFMSAEQILWVSFQRGKPDIYRGNIFGKVPQIFLYSRYIEASPAVDPLLGNIAYASSKSGNMDIFLTDTEGKQKKQLTFSRGIDTSPCFSIASKIMCSAS